MTWLMVADDRCVSIVPENDDVDHVRDDCICGPRWEFRDPDSGEFYARPMVVHHSLDGREHVA